MDEEKVYIVPGMTVTIKHNIPNKPKMFVIKKETYLDLLVGIRCRWFTDSGEVQESIFNTKDLIIIE